MARNPPTPPVSLQPSWASLCVSLPGGWDRALSPQIDTTSERKPSLAPLVGVPTGTRSRETGGPHPPALPEKCSGGTWELAGSPQDPLDAAAAVGGQHLPPPRVYELLGVRQQRLAGWEEAGAEPQQLPAPLLTVPVDGSTGQPRRGPSWRPSPPALQGDGALCRIVHVSRDLPEATGEEATALLSTPSKPSRSQEGEGVLSCPFCGGEH